MSASCLFLEILEELIKSCFDRAFDDHIRNSCNFAFAISMCIVGQECTTCLVSAINNAASTNGAQRAARLGDQLNARIRNHLPGLQEDSVRTTNTRNAGCDG